MVKPSFSIVIPVLNRPKEVVRAIKSVLSQDYDGEFEVIVIDDGSTDDTYNEIRKYEASGLFLPAYVRLFRHEKNRGRMAARNTGREYAKNDWIIDLDSDDELVSTYLSHAAKSIEANTEVKIHTCGALVFNDYTNSFSVRQTFVPKKGEEFKSGKIGTGSFCFHRSLIWKMPESLQPYGNDGCFSHMAHEAVPGIAALYGKTESGQWPPLGNCWGDDWVYFYKITRDNDVVGIPLPLYLVHLRP